MSLGALAMGISVSVMCLSSFGADLLAWLAVFGVRDASCLPPCVVCGQVAGWVEWVSQSKVK